MKKIIYIALIGASMSIYAQTNSPLHEWHITLHVTDEANTPIARAEANIGYFKASVGASVDGFTDTNGNFSASDQNAFGGMFGLVAKKSGYYTTRQGYSIPPRYDFAKWNPTITLILKKTGQPTAMYAKAVRTHVPDLDKPVGYDLMLGDWVGPYGKGINADVNFAGHFDKHDDGESDFTLTVSFPKTGDGIQEFFVPESDKGCELRSSHEAPTNGYQPQWIQYDKRKPNTKIETNRDPNRNYFFRVRTKLDDKGNVVSARYGKIYGDFMTFTYYLNPTPNDRNIEFDPKQNLIHSLKFDEGVSAP